MSKIDKLREKINDDSIRVTYTEMAKFLNYLGYAESNKGKTSGSRVRFFRERDKHFFNLHKPHPGDDMPMKAKRNVAKLLRERGDL